MKALPHWPHYTIKTLRYLHESMLTLVCFHFCTNYIKISTSAVGNIYVCLVSTPQTDFSERAPTLTQSRNILLLGTMTQRERFVSYVALQCLEFALFTGVPGWCLSEQKASQLPSSASEKNSREPRTFWRLLHYGRQNEFHEYLWFCFVSFIYTTRLAMCYTGVNSLWNLPFSFRLWLLFYIHMSVITTCTQDIHKEMLTLFLSHFVFDSTFLYCFLSNVVVLKYINVSTVLLLAVDGSKSHRDVCTMFND